MGSKRTYPNPVNWGEFLAQAVEDGTDRDIDWTKFGGGFGRHQEATTLVVGAVSGVLGLRLENQPPRQIKDLPVRPSPTYIGADGKLIREDPQWEVDKAAVK
jgi:hypothetical protein